MSGWAIALVLSASVMHAAWNLVSKRVPNAGAAFVWLVAVAAAVLYLPAAVVVVVFTRPHWAMPQLISLLGSGLLHLVYFLTLQRGYRVADLSLVYPIARGTGPTLSTLGAILLFGERPSVLALCGTLLVISGVFLISFTGRTPVDGSAAGAGVRWGLLTGGLIACYTLWDKRAVSAPLLIAPLLLDWVSSAVRAVFLAPYALHNREEVAHHWRADRTAVVWVALLSPLAFILVLTAMRLAPLSYVAPAREVSILVGVVLGARLLSEGHAPLRLLAALLMLAGIAALCLG